MNWMCRAGVALLFFSTSFSWGASFKIKNFREIPLSLEAVTGSSRLDYEIDQFFQARAASFPQVGDPYELQAGFLIAQLSFSSFFCSRMVNRDSQSPVEKRWAHGGVDFSKDLTQFEAPQLARLIEEYSQMFWMRSPDEFEAQALREMFGIIAQGQTHHGPLELVSVLSQFCGAFGDSLEFLRR